MSVTIKSSLAQAAVVLICGLVGFVSGRYAACNDSSAIWMREIVESNNRIESSIKELKPSPERTREPSKGAETLPCASSHDELRKVIREELRGFGEPVEAAAGQKEAEQELDDDSDAIQDRADSYEQAKQLLKIALSSRLWRGSQAAELKLHSSKLSLAQRKEIVGELLGAISRGDIVSEGPPY